MGKATSTDYAKLLVEQIASDEDFADDMDRERLNGEIAVLIYTERTKAGLTQAALANKAGTHQSVIARLEDAEYDGRTIELLRQVLRALGLRLAFSAEPLVRDNATLDIVPFRPKVWQDPQVAGRPVETQIVIAAQS